MMTIDEIRKLAATRKIQWTNHCAKQMVERDISRLDVFRCIEEGEIIEDYPNAFQFVYLRLSLLEAPGFRVNRIRKLFFSV